MPLSDHEQQLLEQLERQLNAEDPTFADSMQDRDAPARGVGLSVRHLVIGIVVAVLGLGLVLVGVASKLIVVGVLGFLVMAAGVYYASTGRAQGAGAPGTNRAGNTASADSRRSSGFMQRLEQQWEDRRRS